MSEQLTFNQARMALSMSEREELRDHSFGDREVFWILKGQEIAHGYFSGDKAGVHFTDGSGSFKGNEALELADCGSVGKIMRNDETGPDNYEDGHICPGLTKEAVLQELCSF